jgi:hypothetical protein
MAVFKILSCLSPTADRSEFIVQFRSGELAAGDSFACFDTHHHTTFQVLLVNAATDHAQLVCAGHIGFNNQYAGAVVDTSATARSGEFRYEHAAPSA